MASSPPHEMVPLPKLHPLRALCFTPYSQVDVEQHAELACIYGEACDFLTVGIELEFLVAGKGRDRQMERLIRQEPVGRNCWARRTSQDHLWWDHAWTVKKDGTISCEDLDYAYDGVELTSPILRADSAASYRVMAAVAAKISGTFGAEVNRTCGYHVHVGFNKHVPGALTLKKLATLVWFGETMLFRMCSPQRRQPARQNPGARHFGRVTQHSRLAALEDGPDARSEDYVAWLERALQGAEASDETKMALLWSATTGSQVCQYMLRPRVNGSGVATLSVRFDGMQRLAAMTERDPTAPNPIVASNNAHIGESELRRATGTVEFRMMEGTLDGGLITAWAEVCRDLVGFARDSDRLGFGVAIQGLVDGGIDDVGTFLKAIGCRPELVVYMQKKAARSHAAGIPARIRSTS